MPPPPEGRNAVGAVGIVEVRKELKAEHLCRADGHVRIAAEVKIEHQRIKKRSQPRAADRKRLRPHRLQGIERRPQQTRKQNLLGKADSKQPHAAADALPDELVRLKLRLHLGILHDRA